ncbi:MAG TPA: HIT domain-containing protein [Xanthobacteraceae bacterium]|jgi:diadenosine tetraphosphate (Ap4A) HIT family hydrolase
MPNDFALDPRLTAESHPIGDLGLCRVLLFDDARFPWIVLVPRRARLVEITDLPVPDRHRLLDEIGIAMEALKAATAPYKLNVAALGNSVRQLHVHIIARFEGDAAWPSPVWGRGERVPYKSGAADAFKTKLRAGLGLG